MPQLQSAFGIAVLLAIAWALGENRRAVDLRQAAVGLLVTMVTAVILFKLPQVAAMFSVINDAVGAVAAATRADPTPRTGLLSRISICHPIRAGQRARRRSIHNGKL